MKSCLLVVVLLVLLVLPAISDEISFSLHVDGDAVVACEVPAASQVVFFDVSWVKHPWTQGFSSEVHESYEEGKGRALFSPANGVESNSVWAGVLTTNGDTAFADASDRPLNINKLQSENSLVWKERRIVGVRIPGRFIELLLVRPGKGVWSATAGDGGASDNDQTVNGEVSVFVQSLVPELSTVGQPDFLSSGDVVIAIDVRSMSIYQLKVG